MALLRSVAENNQVLHDVKDFDIESYTFPLRWLLDHASAPIAFRAQVDVANEEIPEWDDIEARVLTAPEALRIADAQGKGGLWNNAMLAAPDGSDDMSAMGTIQAFCRLLEYGWSEEMPELKVSTRTLFRILTEDEDPALLFEFKDSVQCDLDVERTRNLLREASASALAQAGYEEDPRLRGMARKILQRIDNFVTSSFFKSPWAKIGKTHVLLEGSSPPSVYALTMLAHMPAFCSEHHAVMDRLYQYLTQTPVTAEPAQLYGRSIVSEPHAIVGDPFHAFHTKPIDVPLALFWLETMARLGFLEQNNNWMQLFMQFLEWLHDDGVTRPEGDRFVFKGQSPLLWYYYPLEEDTSGDRKFIDVNFRLGLVAQYLGWKINLK